MSAKAIVCVDDEALQLLALKRELRLALGGRYIIETALDADQAISLMDELEREGIEVALLITDWLMPRVKGDELIRLARESRPGLQAILITGQMEDEVRRHCAESGDILSILDKPWRKQELLEAIESSEGDRARRSP
jgi:CheY-like chemotaxis protein